MMEEHLLDTLTPHGKFRDVLIGPDGQIRWETGWQSNVIVDGFRTVLAELLQKGTLSEGPVINLIAIGEGDPRWDTEGLPKAKDRRHRKTLVSTEYEHPVKYQKIEKIDFLDTHETDSTDESSDHEDPSRLKIPILEIRVQFTEEDPEKTWQMREFALFAKVDLARFADDDFDVEDVLSSGKMINHCVHAKHEFSYGDTLQRTIHLSFQKEQETNNG